VTTSRKLEDKNFISELTLIGAFPEQGEAVKKALDNLRVAEKTMRINSSGSRLNTLIREFLTSCTKGQTDRKTK
jgi:hypothetical protein